MKSKQTGCGRFLRNIQNKNSMTGGDYPTLVKLKNVYARYVADTGESDPLSVNSGRLLVKIFQ